MTTLKNQLDKLTRTENQSAAERQCKALRDYWRLLLRMDNPQPGDATAIVALLGKAGKDQDALDADMQKLEELRKAEKKAATLPEMSTKSSEASLAHEAARAELDGQIAALRANVQQLAEASESTSNRWIAARDASRSIPHLIDELQAAGLAGDLADG